MLPGGGTSRYGRGDPRRWVPWGWAIATGCLLTRPTDWRVRASPPGLASSSGARWGPFGSRSSDRIRTHTGPRGRAGGRPPIRSRGANAAGPRPNRGRSAGRVSACGRLVPSRTDASRGRPGAPRQDRRAGANSKAKCRMPPPPRPGTLRSVARRCCLDCVLVYETRDWTVLG